MQVRAALLYMVISRAVSMLVLAGSFIVLGRLLDPAAFGHFAVAMAIFGLADSTVQFGLRQYVVSRRDTVPRETVAAAAGLSLVIALGLAGAGLAVGLGPVGRWLPEPVAACLVPLSLVLLLRPFVLGTESLLQRDIRFELISMGDVVRAVTDLLVTISLVLLGFSAPALAWGFFASHLVLSGLLLVMGGADTRVWPRLGSWSAFFVWGRRMTAIELLPKSVEAAMIGLLSVFQGAATVGLFNRARMIQEMLDRTLFEAISPVILPAISSALRTGVTPSALYRTKLDYLTAICWPGFALIGLLAEPLVRVLLGQQWMEAVPAVRILALIGLSLPATKMSQKLFVAMDRSDRYLRLQFLQDGVRLPLAAIGAMISLEAFAFAYVLGSWFKAVGITIELKRMGVHGAHGIPVLRAVVLTIGTLAGPGLMMANGLSSGAIVAAAFPLALAGWLVAAVLVRHPVIGEIRTFSAGARRRLKPRAP